MSQKIDRLKRDTKSKKEALRAFEQLNGARVIEKNMRTGTEKIIKERVPA